MTIIFMMFFGRWYCNMFHTRYGHTTDDSKMYCKKCDLSFIKLTSDGDTGPGGTPRK